MCFSRLTILYIQQSFMEKSITDEAEKKNIFSTGSSLNRPECMPPTRHLSKIHGSFCDRRLSCRFQDCSFCHLKHTVKTRCSAQLKLLTVSERHFVKYKTSETEVEEKGGGESGQPCSKNVNPTTLGWEICLQAMALF